MLQPLHGMSVNATETRCSAALAEEDHQKYDYEPEYELVRDIRIATQPEPPQVPAHQAPPAQDDYHQQPEHTPMSRSRTRCAMTTRCMGG